MGDKAIYEYTNYTSPIGLVIGRYIYEYDIEHANISILHEAKEISNQIFNLLLKSSKQDREIMVGRLLEKGKSSRAAKLLEVLDNGFLQARKNIIESNQIDSHNILMTRKDSIFVLDKHLSHTRFGEVQFLLKNTYTSYYNLGLNNLVLLYGKKSIGFMKEEDFLVVKGISKSNQDLHSQYMIKFLSNLLYMAEHSDITYVLFELKDFMKKYRNRELPIGYYREFNASSKYRVLLSVHHLNTEYGLQSVSETEDIYSIDIGYNYEVLVKLYQLFSSKYFG